MYTVGIIYIHTRPQTQSETDCQHLPPAL